MNKALQTGTIFFLSLFFVACGSESESVTDGEEVQKTEEVKPEVPKELCLYSYDSESSSLTWTAFKTMQRVGVKGSFNTVNVSIADSVYSLKEAIEKVSFEIDGRTVNTDNPERDKTLVKFFFATLKDEGSIYGEVKIVEGDEKAGGGTVRIKMNDVSRDIGFKYEIVGDEIILKTKITLNSFDGQDAVKKLNTECGPLHAGEDGVSKLWTDIEIEVKAKLNKKC
jgi:polyisoprenoid-binding protein YceI